MEGVTTSSEEGDRDFVGDSDRDLLGAVMRDWYLAGEWEKDFVGELDELLVGEAVFLLTLYVLEFTINSSSSFCNFSKARLATLSLVSTASP